MKIRSRLLAGALAPAFLSLMGPPALAASFGEALADGEVGLGFRYRYELVDQEGFAEDAKASTLRARFNYKSGEASGFSFFIELDGVVEIGADDFNSGADTSGPHRSQFPVVADPDGEDLNQVYV